MLEDTDGKNKTFQILHYNGSHIVNCKLFEMLKKNFCEFSELPKNIRTDIKVLCCLVDIKSFVFLCRKGNIS